VKAFPNRLLFRTALLFALLLIVSQIVWVSVSAGLYLKPFRMEYVGLLATDVKVARSALAMLPPEARQTAIGRFSRESGVAIAPGDAPARELSQPKSLESWTNAVRSLAGDDVDLRINERESTLWMRFVADGTPYWLVTPIMRMPELFSTALLLTASIAVLASLGGAYLLIVQLNGRLRAVVEAARTIGRGGIPGRLAVAGPQEIQDLSRGFNQMSEGLQRLESDRRLMLAGISHDLRTPLARLRLALELSSPALEQAHVLGMVQDISEMDAILEQFLDFSRNDSDEAPQVCDLNVLVSEVCARYQLSGEQVTTSLAMLEPVRLRRLAVRRLITNLLDNGLRYGRQDVEITTSGNCSQIILTVADRGPGIQSGNPQEWIRAFSREDSARSKPGSGLGLTVVDRIARAHGGSLELQNRAGGGLRVTVTLIPL
jgi:two-component system osmolarity sensor histidine kinase EnvZ